VLEIDDDSHEARGASTQNKKKAFGGYELAQSYGSLTEASVMPLPENRLPPVLQYSNLTFTVRGSRVWFGLHRLKTVSTPVRVSC